MSRLLLFLIAITFGGVSRVWGNSPLEYMYREDFGSCELNKTTKQFHLILVIDEADLKRKDQMRALEKILVEGLFDEMKAIKRHVTISYSGSEVRETGWKENVGLMLGKAPEMESGESEICLCGALKRMVHYGSGVLDQLGPNENLLVFLSANNFDNCGATPSDLHKCGKTKTGRLLSDSRWREKEKWIHVMGLAKGEYKDHVEAFWFLQYMKPWLVNLDDLDWPELELRVTRKLFPAADLPPSSGCFHNLPLCYTQQRIKGKCTEKDITGTGGCTTLMMSQIIRTDLTEDQLKGCRQQSHPCPRELWGCRGSTGGGTEGPGGGGTDQGGKAGGKSGLPGWVIPLILLFFLLFLCFLITLLCCLRCLKRLPSYWTRPVILRAITFYTTSCTQPSLYLLASGMDSNDLTEEHVENIVERTVSMASYDDEESTAKTGKSTKRTVKSGAAHIYDTVPNGDPATSNGTSSDIKHKARKSKKKEAPKRKSKSKENLQPWKKRQQL